MKYENLLQYTSNLKILFVEDDYYFQKETTDIFREIFSLTDVANDGIEGLDEYQSFYKKNNTYYDLVFLDINMPKKDGIVLVKEILEINPKQSIVVISANNNAQQLLQLINLGISDFLLKPFPLENFYKVIYKVSKNIYLERENKSLEIEKIKYEYEKILQEEKSVALNELLQNISHQWKQPLSGISTILSSLIVMYEQKIDIENQQELLNKALNYCDQLAGIITKFESNNKSINKSNNFCLKELFIKVKNIFTEELDRYQIELIINYTKEMELYGLAGEIVQVLYAVIKNSIETMVQSTYQKRYILIDSFTENNQLYFQIKDNGGGVDDKVIMKIFDPYFTTKHQAQGVGLGLYFSKEIVANQLNGSIDIKNTEFDFQQKNYSGAVCTIVLPLEYKDKGRRDAVK